MQSNEQTPLLRSGRQRCPLWLGVGLALTVSFLLCSRVALALVANSSDPSSHAALALAANSSDPALVVNSSDPALAANSSDSNLTLTETFVEPTSEFLPEQRGEGFLLPELPYALEALEPSISARTLSFHYLKHHLGYINTTNKLTEASSFANLTLSEVIRQATPGTPLYNNAAQAWNHAFFWQSMAPTLDAGGWLRPFEEESPTQEILRHKIIKSFGSLRTFTARFQNASSSHFGSGWSWLVLRRATGRLEIVVTHDADSPIVDRGLAPLFCLDLWEHAYYLDYQNLRANYIAAFLAQLVNWNFTASNLIQAGVELDM